MENFKFSFQVFQGEHELFKFSSHTIPNAIKGLFKIVSALDYIANFI